MAKRKMMSGNGDRDRLIKHLQSKNIISSRARAEEMADRILERRRKNKKKKKKSKLKEGQMGRSNLGIIEKVNPWAGRASEPRTGRNQSSRNQ